jgi:cell division control protein 12
LYRHAKQLDKTTEVEILKADLEERGFNIKVSFLPLPTDVRAAK